MTSTRFRPTALRFWPLCVLPLLLAWIAPCPGWASVPNFTPWQNIDLYYGSAIRTGAILPVAAAGPDWENKPENGAVVLLGADNGGAARSLNLGRTFDTSNGGRGFSNAICGGYSAAFLNVDAQMCEAAAGATPKSYPLLYGGPPAMIATFAGLDSNISDYASGAWPAGLDPATQPQVGMTAKGTPGMANGLVYRASNHLYVSPDAAASWFPLVPQCEMNQVSPFVTAVAVDRGRPGHVVVGSSDVSGGLHSISGCKAVVDYNAAYDGTCGVQTVASNDDIKRELAAVFLATANAASSATALRDVEVAAGGSPGTLIDPNLSQQDKLAKINAWKAQDKWRYATIAHLATGCAPVEQGSDPQAVATISSWSCPSQVDFKCHGRTPTDYAITIGDNPQDRAAWCPSITSCACKSSPTCRYPQIRTLEIDPRNGWVYAVAADHGTNPDFSLLTSPDGGRSWMRKGNASTDPTQNDSTLPPAIPAGTTGAKILTHQFEPSETGQAPLSDGNALDLARHPENVKFIGRMSVSWQPCSNGAKYLGTTTLPDGTVVLTTAKDYHGDFRTRGTLVATLPVEWLSTTGHRVSSVFVAADVDDCSGDRFLPKALEFRDTANLVLPPGAAAALGEKSPQTGETWKWSARSQVSASLPKLSRQLPMLAPVWMHYGGAAVAGSDSRVLYAWSVAFGFAAPANEDWNQVSSLDAHLADSIAPYGTGLWRSRNRGLTWELVTNLQSPDFHADSLTAPGFLSTVDITVDPQNPHRVMIAGTFYDQIGSGSQMAVMLEPTTSVYAPLQNPETDCAACPGPECGVSANCAPLDRFNDEGATAHCRHDKVFSDYCATWSSMIGWTGIQCRRLPPGSDGYSLVHCKVPGSVGAYETHWSHTCGAVHPSAEPQIGAGWAAGNIQSPRPACVPCQPGDTSLDANGQPKACCLRWRQLVSDADQATKQCVSIANSALPCTTPGQANSCVTRAVQQVGRGGSGTSGQCATFLGSNAPAGSSATKQHIFVGSDDGASNLTVAPVPPVGAGVVTANASGFRLPGWGCKVASVRSHADVEKLFVVAHERKHGKGNAPDYLRLQKVGVGGVNGSPALAPDVSLIFSRQTLNFHNPNKHLS